MLPFCKYGPMDRSERKALWLAILAGSLFIVTLAMRVIALDFHTFRIRWPSFCYEND